MPIMRWPGDGLVILSHLSHFGLGLFQPDPAKRLMS